MESVGNGVFEWLLYVFGAGDEGLQFHVTLLVDLEVTALKRKCANQNAFICNSETRRPDGEKQQDPKTLSRVFLCLHLHRYSYVYHYTRQKAGMHVVSCPDSQIRGLSDPVILPVLAKTAYHYIPEITVRGRLRLRV